MGRCSIGIRAGSQTHARGGLEDFYVGFGRREFRSMQIFQAGTRRRSQTCSECLKTMLRLITMYRDGADARVENFGQMFSGASAFQAKFVCGDLLSGPRKTCGRKRENPVGFVFFRIGRCMSSRSARGRGLCYTFGTVTKKFGVMPDWDAHRVENMEGGVPK